MAYEKQVKVDDVIVVSKTYPEMIRRANYKLATINCLDSDDRAKVIEIIDEIIEHYESKICTNCKYYINYEELKSDPTYKDNAYVRQMGFGFCSLIKIFVDDTFGCNQFEKRELNDTNINNQESEKGSSNE